MKIYVIGAHGKIALQTLPRLTASGADVVGIFRNPNHSFDVEARGAEPIAVDVEGLDAPGWKELLSDADVVIWAAGAGGGNPDRTRAVDEIGAKAAMDATPKDAAFIMISYWGSRADHGIPESETFVHYADAKAAADEHLRKSGLKYVIIKPGSLTEQPSTGVFIGSDDAEIPDGMKRETARELVAVVIEEVVNNIDSFTAAELGVLDGDEHVADAVKAAAK